MSAFDKMSACDKVDASFQFSKGMGVKVSRFALIDTDLEKYGEGTEDVWAIPPAILAEQASKLLAKATKDMALDIVDSDTLTASNTHDRYWTKCHDDAKAWKPVEILAAAHVACYKMCAAKAELDLTAAYNDERGTPAWRAAVIALVAAIDNAHDLFEEYVYAAKHIRP